MEITKDKQFAALIVNKVFELFGTEEGQIKQGDLDGDNLAHFMHALANLAPNYIYQEFTGSNTNNLEFNHIANQLVFQYSKLEDAAERENQAKEVADIPTPDNDDVAQ